MAQTACWTKPRVQEVSVASLAWTKRRQCLRDRLLTSLSLVVEMGREVDEAVRGALFTMTDGLFWDDWRVTGAEVSLVVGDGRTARTQNLMCVDGFMTGETAALGESTRVGTEAPTSFESRSWDKRRGRCL